MLKIRLRRMGAIRQPHYRVVVADARSPRDGRFIENLGHYNPLTDPATIQIDIAKYEEWKKKGAQPTDAVASLVKQFNRTQRKAAEASGEEAAAPVKPNAKTRTASGKRSEPKAEAAPVEEAPMDEGVAEATLDGGGAGDAAGEPESDAVISEAAETGGSANPGAAEEESAG